MIDLRSDTVTAPSAAMREVIASAPVGDDVYGDDPAVNALEERVAALFGKEAGLFTPTGSLANQLMMRTLVQPGQEILAETNSHVVRAELGAAATFSGITSRTWLAPSGTLRAEDPLAIAAPNAGPYLVSTAAIAIENTHNFGGGTVQPLDQMKLLHEQAHEMGIAIHLDGARIWNAHVASGVTLAEYGNSVLVTRALELFSLADVDPAIANIIAYNLADSIDAVAMTTLRGGSNVIYSGSTATSTADALLALATALGTRDQASAAVDAAAEATDAANAATDAANAAAEAADAATAAAQDAADAVAALSTQVSEMVAALKKQITSLTNLVIKIQKKVRA